MSKKILYVLAVPEDAQTVTEKQVARNVSKEGLIVGETSSAKSISLQPNERLLMGEYRGRYAEEMALEFEELFGASDIEEVVFRSDSGPESFEGYYTLEDVTTKPADPRDNKVQKFDGRLIHVGTKRNYWRSMDTNIVDVTNPFDSTSNTEVCVSSSATKKRWFNPTTGEREGVSSSQIAVRGGEFHNMYVYNAELSSYDNPVLIYEMPYSEEGKMDVKIWDTYNRTKRIVIDGEIIYQWGRVFDTSHEFIGDMVMENGCSRFIFDDEGGNIQWWKWNVNTDQYEEQNLGDQGDWRLFDYDITRIGMARIEAQLEFENTSSGEFYSVDVSYWKGSNLLQFRRPLNESSAMPSGLQTWLSPAGDTNGTNAQAILTLRERKEVRK